MSDKPVFIKYNVEEEKAKLKEYFEELTEKKLFPAQLENIMLNVISYKASLLVQKFNEAALLNLPQFSRYPILDFIGELFTCYRLKPQNGVDILKVELYEPMSFDFTISKGLQVLTKDEKYIFETVSDAIIKAGDLFAYVEIQSVDANSDVNNYGAGEINILIKPESYIKSVSNINGVSGGFDEENDESYIKRILLAPEGFSCAGSKNAYIYHTLATHAGILDAQADCPQIPATIEYDGNIYSES
ncbi:MAG: baseplate J/gp47 family protein, partial [Candidatus Gastranaerophilaceae bacterium]